MFCFAVSGVDEDFDVGGTGKFEVETLLIIAGAFGPNRRFVVWLNNNQDKAWALLLNFKVLLY